MNGDYIHLACGDRPSAGGMASIIFPKPVVMNLGQLCPTPSALGTFVSVWRHFSVVVV